MAKRKLRILVITALYPPHHLGGYELRCRDVVERLRARGHRVQVITSMYGVGRPTHEDGVARVLHRMPFRTLRDRFLWDIHDLKRVEQEIALFCPDVIHLWHMSELSRTIISFLSDYQLPVVYDEGGDGLLVAARGQGWSGFYHKPSRTRLRFVAKRVLCHVAWELSGRRLPRVWRWPSPLLAYFNNPWSLERARAAGVPMTQAKVIPPGIDTTLFRYCPRGQESRSVSLVMPGRVSRAKGVHDAISAVHLLTGVEPAQNISLRVIGPIVDTAYYQELVEQAEDLGVASRIVFTGQVTAAELARLYQESDFCLFLSVHQTGFSRVPLEAMGSGCVVVAAGGECSAEAIRDHETGILVPPHSPHSVAHAIHELCRDRPLYARINQRAHAEVASRFTIEQAVAEIESVLLQAVSLGSA